MNTTRVMTTLAALAMCAGTAAACSTAPENTASEPSFENTYPAFEPLQKAGEADMPHQPEPSIGPEPEQPAPRTGSIEAPLQQHATTQGSQYIEHSTNQDVKLATYSELSPQIPQDKASGFNVNLKGTEATVCLMGNGYGISFVMAAHNTSCEFAENTAGILMNNAPSSSSELRDFIPAQLSATSPVTEQTYTLNCRVDDNEIIRCAGGNNAEVLIV